MTYITKYEPPKRRLRIRNKLRFTVSLMLVLLALSIIFIPKQGTSNVNWKPYQVTYGNTYWGIARELQANGYRSKDDIRAVVDELVRKSGIMAHELREGDTILVPDGFLGGDMIGSIQTSAYNFLARP